MGISGELHPATWWVWAILLSATSLRIHQSAALLAVIAALATLSHLRKGEGLWAQSFTRTLAFAGVIIVIRAIFALLIGVQSPGHTILTLPHIPLPDWMAGIRLGGAITRERIAQAVLESTSLVATFLSFACVSSIVAPHRIIRALPKRAHTFATLLVVATTSLPHFASSVERIKIARRYRGANRTRLRQWEQIGIPLMSDALERSLALAQSMEARGFGHYSRTSRLTTDRFRIGDYLVLTFMVYGLIAFPILERELPLVPYVLVVFFVTISPLFVTSNMSTKMVTP